jgi:hypothetical protein
MSELILTPITFRVACAFIDAHHRHHTAPRGYLFGIGLSKSRELVGVATVGRPSARLLQDGFTAEVTRLCVLDNQPNACSKLYAACWRAARALGYTRLVTYILESESGTSIKAAGWQLIGATRGGSWSRESRQRLDVLTEPKQRYEVSV